MATQSSANSTKKDLKYFMVSTEDEIVTVPGISTFKDEDGKVIDFEVKKLSQKEITDLNNKYRKRTMATDKKGNPLINGNEVVFKTERDGEKSTRHLIVEALVYPNLKDKELMEYYNCVDVTEMPRLVFRNSDDYMYVVNTVMKVLGLSTGVDDDEEDLEAAKN